MIYCLTYSGFWPRNDVASSQDMDSSFYYYLKMKRRRGRQRARGKESRPKQARRRLSPPSPSHFKCSWHLRTPVFFSNTHKYTYKIKKSHLMWIYKRKNEIARIYTNTHKHGSYYVIQGLRSSISRKLSRLISPPPSFFLNPIHFFIRPVLKIIFFINFFFFKFFSHLFSNKSFKLQFMGK